MDIIVETEVEVDVELLCDKCDDYLKFKQKITAPYCAELYVSPCENCTENSKDEEE